MSRVIYDTSVVIDPRGLGEWSEHTPTISAITLGELSGGVDKGDVLERGMRRARYNFLSATYQILPFGVAEANAYGLLVSLLREKGRSHRGRALDVQIAATALVYRLPLLTRNPRDLDGLESALQIIPV